ncbi:MAG: hypothetical protein HN742_24845 [Lentisphaerae bacterium]|jgi:hypothetical protein|nr:hypothetical protein [Lentisphaerota bacterium]MBT4815060.1 hypothetical protein [Lentisphaerota bacterium]MBT5608749.1 hypothetical protein [Lentisphaerota bacterium]MBT7054090.1 hypothetical protein [Lentisphaerota bacterium]MBT7845129.1 hypothetical protein [Lentisphaerota bacterium]
MKTRPKDQRNESPTTPDDASDVPPPELRPLLVGDDEIIYPDTPEWQNIGATARLKFNLRQESSRSFHIVRYLAAAAAVLVIASVAALRLRSPGNALSPELAGTGHSATQPGTAILADTGTAADGTSIEEALSDIHALASQFELDYVALELVRSGTLRQDETHYVHQILESYEIDAAEVFLASRAVL